MSQPAQSTKSRENKEASPGSPPAPASGVRSTWLIYVLAVLTAGLVGGVIAYSFLSESLAALGIPDPGPATTFGLPFFRAAAWVLAALSIGSFMFSAFYISPCVPDNDNHRLNQATLTVDGHIAARTGGVAALCYAVISLLMVPMVLSDISGTPLHKVLDPASLNIALTQIITSQVWLICAILGLLVGIVGLALRTWPAQPGLMVGAIIMIVPLGMEGHAATGGDHDYGTNAYLWHLVFMSIWIGGIMALIAHGRRLGPNLPLAVRRYSAVALFAIIVVAISGVISAVIRINPEDLFTSRYGLIIVTKVVLTIVLGFFGFTHRQITIPQLGKNNHAFIRLAIVELLVMAVTAGVAVTMGRTPPPAPDDPNLTSMQIQMGYNLHEAPSFFNVWTIWRFDILWGTIGMLLTVAYAWGLWKLHRRGKKWETKRSVYWFIGSISLVIFMSSGIGMYMPSGFYMHMLVHMLLSMVVPLALVLGAPLSLIMEVWDSGKPGEPNIHDWARAFTRTKVLDVLTIPWVNLLQFLVVFYAMYLYIPLYNLAISEHAGHVIMNTMFLLSGYIYFWELVGPDYVPNRVRVEIRLTWLVISMPIHLFLGVYLMQLNVIMGEAFYLSLELPWNPDLLADQRRGGGIGWAFGSFPLTYVLILLVLEWRAKSKEEEKLIDARLDHRTEGTASAEAAEEEIDEFEAYNQMLARYNAGEDMLRDYYGRDFDTPKKQK